MMLGCGLRGREAGRKGKGGEVETREESRQPFHNTQGIMVLIILKSLWGDVCLHFRVKSGLANLANK